MHLPQRRAGPGMGAEPHKVEDRVGIQQPDQLPTGISGRTDHRRLQFHLLSPIRIKTTIYEYAHKTKGDSMRSRANRVVQPL